MNYRWVRAITERFGRVNFGRLEIEVTVDDPKVYTKPWTVKISQMLQPDTDLIDFIYAEKGQTTHGCRRQRGCEMTMLAAFVVAALAAPLPGQWLHYPNPGMPRTADGKPNLSAPTPRTADGKPDLSGIWALQRPLACAATGCVPPEFGNIAVSLKDGLPYQPWARELAKNRRESLRMDDPISHCLPPGIVELETIAYKKIVQTPGLLLILHETEASYRQIFTDGRSLPVDPNPAFNGYSIGKWEGETLVVQTAGFRDGIWLDVGGDPVTDAAKITERFRRVNYGRLEIDLTVDDLKAYTKPWTVKLTQVLEADTDLMDNICLENEKDMKHMVGK